MKLIIKNRFFFYYIVFSVFFSCKSPISNGLKNGDLLFVTAKSEGLSAAINNVTKVNDKTVFDHIGIVELNGKSSYVLHAAPKGGSQKQLLVDFLDDQKKEGQKVVVYRLKKAYQSSISDALKKANTLLGKPYNFDYILNENSYYCSDFIERVFKKDHIFTLEAMTFIDPSTGKTNVFWQEFYSKKGLEVPEGKLGCNPNGLSASEKLEIVKIIP